MATFDLKITLHRASYAKQIEFRYNVEGFAKMFYRLDSQCSVDLQEDYAFVYVSSNERSILLDHSTYIGRIEIERGDFTEECGIDIASLAHVFDEEGVLDLLASNLKRTTRYVTGHVHAIDKVPISAHVLRMHNWDQIGLDARLFLLRRLLVDLNSKQRYEYIEVSDSNGNSSSIYDVSASTVEELFGTDAESFWEDD